jgi:hypothetical protein
MNCPDRVARILLAILKTAVLRIRAAGWRGDAGLCAVEADHVHNVPDLLTDFSIDGLRFYWEVVKPAYARASGATDLTDFRPLWDELEQFLESCQPAEAG